MTVAGWMPSVDIGLTAGAQRPPGLAACVDLFKRDGMTMNSDTDYGLAGIYCDEFFFFRDALRAASGVSVQGFVSGAASLGSSFKTSVVYGASQSPARRDGGNVYRVAAYTKECNCFKYVGAAQQMPS